MKYIKCVIIITIIALTSCKGKVIRNDLVESKYSKYNLVLECDCDSLVELDGFILLEDSLFTGTCEKWFKIDSTSSYKSEERQFFEGKRLGITTVFDYKGDVKDEIVYVNGILASELSKPCNCDSLEVFVASDSNAYSYLNQNPFSGDCIEYYENNKTIKTSLSFENGLINGDVITYSEEGKVLSMVKYIKGKEKR
jgi:antitoxin component YwqK of YwqJK toxin-antitoxin module